MLSNALYPLVLAAASAITARPDAECTLPETPVTTRVLANDTSSDAPLDTDSVTVVEPSDDGATRANANGTVTFTPAPGFAGITTYQYRVCDSSTPTPACATAIVTITVTSSLTGGSCSSRAAGSGGGAGAGSGGGGSTVGRGGLRVSIKNVYDAKYNFGPLGRGSRDGTDTAEGVLRRQGNAYVGIVDAAVDSRQVVSGLGQNCGPATYVGSQKLKVIGHPVNGFNPLVQTVDAATLTGQASNEYLALEFSPETMTSHQTSLRLPEQMLGDLVVACHTLIDTLSGIAFLPLNDTRWTMEGGGYVIRLPSSGTIMYTDETVPTAGGAQLGPFQADKSVWTIEVERLP
jgi:hypothetical protein